MLLYPQKLLGVSWDNLRRGLELELQASTAILAKSTDSL